MTILSQRGAFLAASILAVVIKVSAATVAWNFDTDAQGWQIDDFAGTGDYTTPFVVSPVTYHSTGGASGGYISAIDPSDGTFLFQAPSTQLGDFSAFLGGKLTFSLQTDQETNWTADSVVVLRGASSGLTLISPLAQPGFTWTNYSIDLVASSFRYGNLAGSPVSAADLSAVLSDLGTFLINAEYHAGVSETTGLDQVAFTSLEAGPTPVPEPTTYGLLGAAALLGLMALRRRARG